MPTASNVTHALTITRQVSEQLLADLLVTAAEGGSNYWASFTEPRPAGGEYVSVHVTEHAPHSRTPRVSRRVGVLDMLEGLRNLSRAVGRSGFPAAVKHLNDALEEDYDATTADVVLQMALFDEVIYG